MLDRLIYLLWHKRRHAAKRRLEKIAIEAGASRSCAKRIAALYFDKGFEK